jgi:hypothetical protein
MGHRTFAEMLEAIKQHHDGLVSDAELIMVLQCDQFQIDALNQIGSLPMKAIHKVGLLDWDDQVEMNRQRALRPLEK